MENKTGSSNLISGIALLGKGVLIFINSLLIIYSVKIANEIYLPTFLAGLSGLIIGLIEPKKGWILALLQAVIMIIMYLSTGISEVKGARLELEMFTLIGSVLFVLIVSCAGGFIKRAK